jgi:SAM-dependent methyltransferase
MVEAAKGVANEQGTANCRFARMDAEALTFEAGAFDVALCALGLMYAPDPERAVTEMYRVLAPGGRCVSAVWGDRRNCGWAEIFPIVDARVQSEVCPMFFRIGTGDNLERAFVAAGFKDVRVRRLRATLDYENGDEACEAAFVGGPVALAYDRFSDAMRADAHADYLASIERYRRGDGYAVPGEFVIASGMK